VVLGEGVPRQVQDLYRPACAHCNLVAQVVLGEGVPRQVQDLYRSVWLNLNAVYPRKLWLLTVNHLRLKESVVSRNLTQEELALDPLAVLRCHESVFRSGTVPFPTWN
jgi:hypothetical protein